jgi:thioredoxin reductase (NADPH)
MAQRPALLVIVDLPDRRDRLVADLARRFDRDYEVLGVHSAEGFEVLARLGASGSPVAAVIADAELPHTDSSGVQLLAQVRSRQPAAKRILLVERGKWHGHPVQQAMVLGQVDAYLFVPWEPPKELWLYLPMTEFLADWSHSQPPEGTPFTIVGEQWHPRSHQLRDILSRGRIPFVFIAADSVAGQTLLAEKGVTGSVLPLVVHFSGVHLEDPSDQQLAELLGFPAPSGQSYDVAIIGGGPAGLSAAVYASSEGLRTCLIDPSVPGGQAGSSSMIRNYLGFPRGLSGAELTNRAVEQAWLLGTEFLLAEQVAELTPIEDGFLLTTGDGDQVTARSVVLACGVSWRRLEVPALEALVGAGVFYGAAGSEADALADGEVYVIGGGNSAGQAAIHLAKRARRVSVVIRRSGLTETMSHYLIRQIEAIDNIIVLAESEVIDGSGNARLRELLVRDRRSGTTHTLPADGLFVMIGGEPCTGWLRGRVATDAKGYLLTGNDAAATGGWTLPRPPLFSETSQPGVFAVGDVVHGSSKRVASSVGSGAVAIQLVHQYLAGLGPQRRE